MVTPYLRWHLRAVEAVGRVTPPLDIAGHVFGSPQRPVERIVGHIIPRQKVALAPKETNVQPTIGGGGGGGGGEGLAYICFACLGFLITDQATTT